MGGRRIRLIYLPLVAVIGGGPQGTYRSPRPPGVRWVLDGWSEDTVNISTISSGHWGGGTSGYVLPSPSTRGTLDGWSEDMVNISTISSSHWEGKTSGYVLPSPSTRGTLGVRWVVGGYG